MTLANVVLVLVRAHVEGRRRLRGYASRDHLRKDASEIRGAESRWDSVADHSVDVVDLVLNTLEYFILFHFTRVTSFSSHLLFDCILAPLSFPRRRHFCTYKVSDDVLGDFRTWGLLSETRRPHDRAFTRREVKNRRREP